MLLLKLLSCGFFCISLGVVVWKSAGYLMDAMHGLPDDYSALDREEEL